ncbi:MAG TPA: hypothetical protein VIT62_04805 [Lysobacter sp.]
MVPRYWVLVAAMAIGNACAQTPVASEHGDNHTEPATANQAGAGVAVTSTAVDTPACRALCAGSAVELEIAEPISSARHKNGDRFALRLVTPLTADSVEYAQAGTTGAGDVVHASPSRGGGKPGELLLAARYLELPDGRRIALRAMKLSARGKDTANAALATAMVIGPFAMFVHGGEIEIPAGTRATAKLAQDIALAASGPIGGLAPPEASPANSPLTDSTGGATDGDASHPTPRQTEVPEGTVSQP